MDTADDTDGLPSDLITPTEATTVLPKLDGRKVSVRSVYRWIENGHLPFWRLAGGRILIRRADVLALIRAGGARRAPRLRPAASQTAEHAEAVRSLREQGIV